MDTFLESLLLEKGMKYHFHSCADHRVNMENNTHSDIVNRDMEGD